MGGAGQSRVDQYGGEPLFGGRVRWQSGLTAHARRHGVSAARLSCAWRKPDFQEASIDTKAHQRRRSPRCSERRGARVRVRTGRVTSSHRTRTSFGRGKGKTRCSSESHSSSEARRGQARANRGAGESFEAASCGSRRTRARARSSGVAPLTTSGRPTPTVDLYVRCSRSTGISPRSAARSFHACCSLTLNCWRSSSTRSARSTSTRAAARPSDVPLCLRSLNLR